MYTCLKGTVHPKMTIFVINSSKPAWLSCGTRMDLCTRLQSFQFIREVTLSLICESFIFIWVNLLSKIILYLTNLCTILQSFSFMRSSTGFDLWMIHSLERIFYFHKYFIFIYSCTWDYIISVIQNYFIVIQNYFILIVHKTCALYYCLFPLWEVALICELLILLNKSF